MAYIPTHLPPAAPSAQAWLFAFAQRDLLLPDGESQGASATLAPHPSDVVDALAESAQSRHYLGTLGSIDCWALALPDAPAGWRRLPLRAAMVQLSERDGPFGEGTLLAPLAGRAAQILEWDRTHRHCGVCGTPTLLQPGERARQCPACGHSAYPRLSPAMMALVWRPGELLLARSPHYTPGMYSALAGFVEAGESLEDCIHREVAEETAVRVDDLRYVASQSWPFPHSLMVAFTARWTGGEVVPQPGEIEDASWFPIDALPDLPGTISIAGRLIREAVARMRASPSGDLT